MDISLTKVLLDSSLFWKFEFDGFFLKIFPQQILIRNASVTSRARELLPVTGNQCVRLAITCRRFAFKWPEIDPLLKK